MTAWELLLSANPHKKSGVRHKPWAVMALTRLGKFWRFYRSTSIEGAYRKAFSRDDCMDVKHIVPICEAAYIHAVKNSKDQSNYDQRRAKKTWAARVS